jgi:hypothetical protein
VETGNSAAISRMAMGTSFDGIELQSPLRRL